MTKNSRIKVLFFTAHLNLGGIENVLLNYAKGLSLDNKYEVIFLTCRNEIKQDIASITNVQFESLNINKIRNCIPALISFLSSCKPDYLFTASKWTLYAYIANKLSKHKTKIITSQHNYLSNNPEVGFLHKFTLKYIYALCYKIIAVSDGIEKLLNQEMCCNKDKIIKIYNPIDNIGILKLSKYHDFESTNKYIVFVGRLSNVKNLDLLINSFASFRKIVKDITLLIIGEGDQEDRLKSLSQKLGLTEQILFLGTKANPYPYIANAKLLCLSSFSEAFPTVLLEALTLGITSVSTPTNGALEILKYGKFGYISQTLTEKDYTACMIEAYNNPLNQEMLQTEIEKNYSLESRTKELKKIMI